MEHLVSDIKYNILFLSKWYPDRNDPQNGVFVKKHAKAAALYCNVALLYPTQDEHMQELYKKEITREDNVYTVIVYYKKDNSIFKKPVNAFRYLKACGIGLKEIQNDFGKPDLVHVNILNRPGIIALALKVMKGIPYIVTEHWTGYLNSKYAEQHFAKRIINGIIIRNAKAVTTVSNNLKEVMLRLELKNNYTVIPNVVDLADSPGKLEKSNKKIILTVADLEDSKKNVSATIKAIAAISKSRPDIEFHIIGDGEDGARLRQLASDLNVFDKFVFFHGRQSNEYVYSFLKKTDFVVVNSNFETFSVITAEALANGKPVIATVSGGPEEFLAKDFGVLIECRNQKQLEEAIVNMLEHHQDYDAEKLKDFVKHKFSANAVGQQLYKLYQSIITEWEVGLFNQHVHIHPEWNVLDVGSGHRPNRRANVLLDNEVGETVHRSGKKAIVPENKKMVIGDALAMPFKDKEFDFVIASHIAEHVDDPERLCNELMRVGKRGYIETPGPLDELFLNETFHKWIVRRKGDSLLFTEKKSFKPFSKLFYRIFYLNETRSGYQALHSENALLKLISKFLRKVWAYLPLTSARYYWEDTINVKVIRYSSAEA